MQPFNGVTHYVLTRNVGCPYMGESVFVRKSYKSKDQSVELPRAVADPARARGHGAPVGSLAIFSPVY